MSRAFRSAPMGFNKKDVVTYIEELVKEKDSAIARLSEELEAASSRGSELESRCDMLTDERRFASAQIEQYKTMCSEAETKAEELTDRLEQAQKQAESDREEKILLQADAARYLAECELLRRNMEKLEAERAQLNESLEAMAQQYSLLEEARSEEQTRLDDLEALRVELENRVDYLTGESSENGELIEGLEAERDSLKAANLRLLKHNDELENRLAAAASSASVQPSDAKSEMTGLPSGSQALLALFKSRVDDMSAELSSLAQAILDAEKAEGSGAIDDEDIDFLEQVSWDAAVREFYPERESLGVRFEDIALPEEVEDEDIVEDDGIPETHVELKDYPAPEKPERPGVSVSQPRRGGGIRDMLDRLMNIGERFI